MNLRCIYEKFLAWLTQEPVGTPEGTDYVIGVENGEIVRFEINDLPVGGVAVTNVSSSAGTLTLDFAGKSRAAFTTTLTENTTLAFANLPASGFLEYRLNVTQDGTGGRTLTLPVSHHPSGGSDTAIVATAGATTILAGDSMDVGTTWDYAMQERG